MYIRKTSDNVKSDAAAGECVRSSFRPTASRNPHTSRHVDVFLVVTLCYPQDILKAGVPLDEIAVLEETEARCDPGPTFVRKKPYCTWFVDTCS